MSAFIVNTVTHSIKKFIQRSPTLYNNIAFIESIKVTVTGPTLKVEYLDEEGSVSEISDVEEEVTVGTISSDTRKKVIEAGIRDAIPKIFSNLLFK